MIKNYFISAFRSLLRNKAYTLINVFGLAIGMAACLLIFVIVRYELSYDKFQPNYANIYHVFTKDESPDGTGYTPGIPFPALEALRNDLPQLTYAPLFSSYGSQLSVADNQGAAGQQKKFIEDLGVFFSEPAFFKVFHYKWLLGNEKVLAEPNTIVLTKSMAEKYFGKWQNAVGHLLSFDNALLLKVSGIIEDVPLNSDFPIRCMASYISLKTMPDTRYTAEWGSTTSNFQIYFTIPPGQDPKKVSEQLVTFSKKYYKFTGDSNKRTNIIRPLSEIHFDQRIGNMGYYTTPKSSLTTLSLIAFLIIVMACINFINLSTAQAVSRSKEIGVRKVLGGNRAQLFWQMMGETHLLVLSSALISLALAALSVPFIKNVISIQEELPVLTPDNVLFLIVCVIVVTVMAGIYPALILSGFQPVLALKNKISRTSVAGISLRRGLVVVQFVIAQMLTIATIVAVSQMRFVRHADLGFNKEALLILYGSNDNSVIEKYPFFKNSLLEIPGVKNVSFCSDPPSSDNNSGTNFAFNHKPHENFTLYLKFGDEDYFKTFGLAFVAGGPYRKSDTINEVVVNETLLKKLGIKDPAKAIGMDLQLGIKPWKAICGVVKDFKTNSLREEVKPLFIASSKKKHFVTSIKLNSSNLGATRAAIEKLWNSYFPQYVFNSSYLDESIERFYQQESQMALLYNIFAGLSIFISCLGLYGLISFMAVQRTKEVGIRKVLGAGISSIIYLFSKEFTLLISLAFVIAAPLAWYFMNEWLSSFVFRIRIGAGIFIAALVTSLLLAWFTVGYKALKAALANPVKSLRAE